MRILHLSDLHFGYRDRKPGPDGKRRSAHYFTDRHDVPQPEELVRIVTNAFKPVENEDTAVVVSGDLGWSGCSEDYTYAVEFLEKLRTHWASFGRIEFVLTPGNHDVDLLTRRLPAERKQNAYIDAIQRFYGADYARLYPFATDVRLDVRQRIISVHYKPDSYLFVTLNSAAALNKRKDRVVIEPVVLQVLDQYLAQLGVSDRTFRTLVLHHHVLPFAEPTWAHTADVSAAPDRVDTTTVANSAKLQKWLADSRFHLVLHGHKHIFHGRKDRLWDEERSSRSIVILGAGSASVTREELGGATSHMIGEIRVDPLLPSRWRLNVRVGRIELRYAYNIVRDWQENKLTVGDPRKASPYYEAMDMDLCHRAITADYKDFRGSITGFMSIVHEPLYVHPETVQISGRHASQEEVEMSFLALHPEYDKTDGWVNSVIDKRLRRDFKDYRIQHGPRMFGVPPNTPRALAQADARPVHHALKSLPNKHTRAFFSLYSPERDILGGDEALPGLVGVQFLPQDDGTLALAMMFRNIELSFWWAVNMREAILLLEWACKHVGDAQYRPGKIIFFSSFAEWRTDPRPVFVSDIDELASDEMFVCVVRAGEGDTNAIAKLATLLSEKAEETNVLNIDYRGLERLYRLAKGVVEYHREQNLPINAPIDDVFVTSLREIVDLLEEAVTIPSRRADSVARSETRLRKLVQRLPSS